MKKESIDVVLEWLASLAIGFVPLAMHALLHMYAKKNGTWEDSWAGDIFLVSISNSGLSLTTVFIRLAKNNLPTTPLAPVSYLMMTLTSIFFMLSGMQYGLVASGISEDSAIYSAFLLLVCSAGASLYFELAIASRLRR